MFWRNYKKTLYYLVLCMSCVCLGCNSKDFKGNKVDEATGMKNEEESVEKYLKTVHRSEDFKDGAWIVSEQEFYEYDNRGDMIKHTKVNQDGSYEVEKYNEKGDCIVFSKYAFSNALIEEIKSEYEYKHGEKETKSYVYDSNGNLQSILKCIETEKKTEEYKYDRNENLQYVSRREYDDYGEISYLEKNLETGFEAYYEYFPYDGGDWLILYHSEIKEGVKKIYQDYKSNEEKTEFHINKYYDEDGKCEAYAIIKLDANRKVLSHEEYDADHDNVYYNYLDYDENGKLIKEDNFNYYQDLTEWSTVRKYDEHGNIVRIDRYEYNLVYEEGGLFFSEEYSYEDEKLVRVKSIYYDLGGEVSSTEYKVYNEDGECISQKYYDKKSVLEDETIRTDTENGFEEKRITYRDDPNGKLLGKFERTYTKDGYIEIDTDYEDGVIEDRDVEIYKKF